MAIILSWGANSHGQLGQNILSEESPPLESKIVPCTNIVTTIASGGAHSVALDDHGILFSCGWNNHFQLGNDYEGVKMFIRIWKLGETTFKSVSCGWDATCAISSDDHLYVWGSNSYGQLGLPRNHYPKNVLPFKLELCVKSVSMGLRHSAVIDMNDNIWTTGSGKMGQLGLGQDIILMDSFTQVPNVSTISLISCGQHHTLAYSYEDHILYAWGDNRFGQLLNLKESRVFTPMKVDIDMFEAKIKQLQSGWTHVAALIETGRVYLWGRNNYGQLGCPTKEVSYNELTIPGNPEISEIALGSEHSMCLTVDHSIWSWGWNEHSNTGVQSHIEIIWNPTDMRWKSNYKPLKIFSGSGQNFASMLVENKTS